MKIKTRFVGINFGHEFELNYATATGFGQLSVTATPKRCHPTCGLAQLK